MVIVAPVHVPRIRLDVLGTIEPDVKVPGLVTKDPPNVDRDRFGDSATVDRLRPQTTNV